MHHPLPRGPHHSLLVTHIEAPGVMLTYTEPCPAAHEELGGLGDGAVIGAVV